MVRRIGPYELRGELGRGAMARVWRAWDPKLEREVAIKEPLFGRDLPPDVAAEMGRRFVEEGRAAARLSHPNIVTIYAAEVWDGRPAIVMELVEGGTLARALRDGPLPAPQALAVLDQLLDAVGYAHARGVVHRDVKPDNVFVGADGRVRLADFGVARVEGSRATVAGAVLGTPGYMSPEQATGAAVDGRSDLFSVGVVAYEMLCGRPPFGEGDATTLLYRVVHEPAPELPASASAGLPADLRPAVMAALSKDPADRPATAEEFKRMLHGQAAPPRVEPGPDGGAARRRAPSWLPYALVAGVAAVVLLFVLLNAIHGSGGGGGGGYAPTPVTDGGVATNDTASDGQQGLGATVGSQYYVASSNGYVAIYTNSSASPYEMTDISVTDLGSESAARLDARIQASSLDEASAEVERLRSEADGNKASRATVADTATTVADAAASEAEAKAHPPVFTRANASSSLAPDQYTSYYGPDNAVDGVFTTSWNEGAAGDGVGEWVEVAADTPQWVHGVRIVNGYPKSDEIYHKNNRCRNVTITLSDGYVASTELYDAYREYQEIDFGDYHQTNYVRITISSVYEGSEWEDTSICEIQPY